MNSQTNLILATDSYKIGHWRQYPEDTRGVYSYFESRVGARFPYTVFFGLQSILKRYMVGSVVKWDHLTEALRVTQAHFTDQDMLNYQGWQRIITEHGGRLPLRIKAVKEGTCVPTGNVLMTVENTDLTLPWLTNAMESLLTHVWYPSTVATLSHTTLAMIDRYVRQTGGDPEAVKFMLHDFGYRGVSSHESGEIGGAAHLVNGVGTDTLPAILFARDYYNAPLETLAFSVPATEHSVMTAEGEQNEFDVVDRLLNLHPTGILSVVADSYNIYRFVNVLGTHFRDVVLARDGVFVIRPDSVTEQDPTPEREMTVLMAKAWELFGGSVNDKGFKVLDPHVRFLWGDGIDYEGIDRILSFLEVDGFAAENMATFGMGGGLLQKVNRDTQRFAFKMAAIKRGEEPWTPAHKTTHGKESKAGRLHLVRTARGELETITVPNGIRDELEVVFEDGKLVREQTFGEVRALAAEGRVAREQMLA